MRRVALLVGVASLAQVLTLQPAAADDWSDCTGRDQARKIEACNRIIAAGRRSTDDLALAHGQRALAYSRGGQHQLAIVDFVRAIKLKPMAWFYQEQARVYRRMGEFDLAVDALTEAI